MTTLPSSLTGPIAIESNKLDVLTDIFRNDVNLAVWNRALNAEAVQFVDRFVSMAGRFERIVGVNDQTCPESVLPRWALNIDGARSWLSDITFLMSLFQCLFEPKAIGLRVHVLDGGSMCPRFHTDRVPVRLLTTYKGTGTEWLPEQAVKRPLNGDQPLPGQNVDHHRIQRIQLGAIALLKGESWEGNEGRGLVHRSPSQNNESRLIVGMDWL